MEVGQRAVLESRVEDDLVKILLEVYYCVLKHSSASWVITPSSRFVIENSFRIAHTEVTHVAQTAFHALLQISVSMKFRDIFHRNATLSMQAIDILRDYVLEVTMIHHLDQSHVR
jgi:hypothetical protein